MNLELSSFDWSTLIAGGLVDRVEYFPSLASTNDHARVCAANMPSHERLLIVADEQTAGRGRGTNRWWTGPESLACSLLFYPAARGIEPRYYPMISLAAAIAIVETVAAATGRNDTGLHWPNDVFIVGRKLAGVLIEGLADGRHVLGIGCNLNNRVIDAPPELARVATSLADVTGRTIARGEFLADLLKGLDRWLGALADEPANVGQRANELCLQHAAALTVRSGTQETSGICAGIAEDGALLLDTLSGRQPIYSGVLVKG